MFRALYHRTLVLALVILLASAALASARADITLSIVPLSGSTLYAGQTGTFGVELSGLSPGQELDALAATVIYDDTLLGVPSISPGAIVPDPLDDPLDFVVSEMGGLADASFLTFALDSPFHITSDGMFFSFDVTALAPGAGTLSFDLSMARRNEWLFGSPPRGGVGGQQFSGAGSGGVADAVVVQFTITGDAKIHDPNGTNDPDDPFDFELTASSSASLSYSVAPTGEVTGTLTIPAQSESVIVEVTPLQDTIFENFESVQFNITSAQAAAPSNQEYGTSSDNTATVDIQHPPEFVSDKDSDPPADPLPTGLDTFAFSVSNMNSGAEVAAELDARVPTGRTKQYSIQSGNHDGLFAIDENTGRLTLAKKWDEEASTKYTLIVHVTDKDEAKLYDLALVDVTRAPVVGITGDIHAIEGSPADTISFQLARAQGHLADEITVRFKIDWAAPAEDGLHPTDFVPSDPNDPTSIFPSHVEQVEGTTNEYEVTIGANQKLSAAIVMTAKSDTLLEQVELGLVTVLPDPQEEDTYRLLPHLGEFVVDSLSGRNAYERSSLRVLDAVTRFGEDNAEETLRDADESGIDTNDIQQTFRGNCTFMAALVALVRDNPTWIADHIEESALDAEGNKEFTVTLFNAAKEEEEYDYNVRTDNILARGLDMAYLTEDFHYDEDPAHDGVEIWPQLYEKAYDDKGASMTHAATIWPILTGKDATATETQGKTDQEIYDAVATAFNTDGKQVIFGTKDDLASGSKVHKNHAYVLTQIEDGHISLHNPWGSEHPTVDLEDLTSLFEVVVILDSTKATP